MADSKIKAAEMETKSIPHLIFSYSSATFCALFFNALYNIVDTLFISHGVGDNAMGGVSVAFPFMLIQAGIAQMVGGGAAVLVSKHLGEKKYKKACSVTATAMLIFYTTAVITTVIGFLLISPILRLTGVTDDALPYAKEYLTIILLGNVFSTGFSSIIRAEGRMGYSLAIWLIPTAVNILLDYVFINLLHLGVRGAALATVLSYFTSFIMSVLFFTKISCQNFRGIKISKSTVKDIILLGIPTLIQTSTMSLIFFLVNRLLSKFGGTTGLNTFAYISKIAALAIVPINSISQAVSPIISYNHGASNTSRIKSTLKFSLIITEAFSVCGVMSALTVPQLFIRLFTSNSEIISEGSSALKILSTALLFMPFVIILSSYFQSTGRKERAILSSSSLILFLIILLLILPNLLGINGIWAAIPVSCILSAILSIVLKTNIKHNKKTEAAE